MAQLLRAIFSSVQNPQSTSPPPGPPGLSDLHPQTWQRELLLPPSSSPVRGQVSGASSPTWSAASFRSSWGGMPLAEGWEVRHSRSKNRPFYVNKTTGVTQWEHPGVVSNTSRVLNARVVHGQNRCVRQY